MCLKTDAILFQYTFYQFQYFVMPCLFMVEIYQEMFQSNLSEKKRKKKEKDGVVNWICI